MKKILKQRDEESKVIKKKVTISHKKVIISYKKVISYVFVPCKRSMSMTGISS